MVWTLRARSRTVEGHSDLRSVPRGWGRVNEFYLNKPTVNNEGTPWCAVGEFEGGAV